MRVAGGSTRGRVIVAPQSHASQAFWSSTPPSMSPQRRCSCMKASNATSSSVTDLYKNAEPKLGPMLAADGLCDYFRATCTCGRVLPGPGRIVAVDRLDCLTDGSRPLPDTLLVQLVSEPALGLRPTRPTVCSRQDSRSEGCDEGTIPTWRPTAKLKRWPAEFRKRSAR